MDSTLTCKRTWRRAGLALTVLWTAIGLAQQPSAQTSFPNAGPLLPLAPDQVLAHVRQTVSWYRDLSGVEQTSIPGVDTGARRELQEQALTAVRKAFEFGKAAAAILGRQAHAQARAQSASGASAAASKTGQAAAGQAAGQSSGQRSTGGKAAPTLAAQLEQSAADLSSREAALKSQIGALDAELRRARRGAERSSLTAQRAGAVAALQLVQQIESNVDQLRHFEESAIAGRGKPPKGLRAQLAVLQQPDPELATGEEPAGTSTATPQPGAATSGHTAAAAGSSKSSSTGIFQPESAGIVGLIGQWFKLQGDRGQLEADIKETTSLEKELTDTRSRVMVTVRRLVGTGLASITSGSSSQLAAYFLNDAAATERLRELSGVIIPLAEQALTLSNTDNILDGWSHTLAAEESTVASYLGFRV